MISKQGFIRNRKSHQSQAKVFWDRTAKSAQGELGKSLKHVRCTRLVFLKGHSSKEWEVPGWLFCA